VKIALAQINPTVGDLPGNAALMLDFARRAAGQGADLIAFPELSLSGYPPRDLVELPAYLDRNELELRKLAERAAPLGIGVVCGYVGRAGEDEPRQATNSAAYLAGGEVVFRQRKMLLPTYDVFDEWRYFAPAQRQQVCEINGLRVGLTICEDVWNDKQFWKRPRYDRDPVEELAAEGMDLLLNISSSPYHMHKRKLRLEMIQSAAKRWRTPVAMVNQTGGNDQLIFDGSSLVAGPDGRLLAQAASFQEDLIYYDTGTGQGGLHAQTEDECEAVYDALVLGLRDYCRKCGFRQAIIGLSGGIDSTLTALIAAEALGPENLLTVAMPGPYSSEGSLRDARLVAEKLGVRFEVVSITESYEALLAPLKPIFGDRPPDTTEENIQARLRGNTLMALSNKFGAIVLATGNKSELAVGYCTLYGDMAGGLAVISDVPKTLVYKLARAGDRRHGGAVPEEVFSKPPSAELRPDQKDTDSLPSYDLLDSILKRYVEDYQDPETIAKELGVELDLVREISRKVDRNEYKRQQAAPGLRVTSKAFGMGRRFPIAQRFTPG